MHVAFIAFFPMVRSYPETGGDAGICEIGREDCPRKTFWAKAMCVRGGTILGYQHEYGLSNGLGMRSYWVSFSDVPLWDDTESAKGRHEMREILEGGTERSVNSEADEGTRFASLHSPL
jgi:hypothetical protein